MNRMQLKTDAVKLEAHRICQEFLGSPWTEIEVSQFHFSVVSGGLSNSIYRCSLPDAISTQGSRTPREVLLRIYGALQDEPGVVATEAATFMLLAERKLGPKLYGVFPKGRLEEFIPSRMLKTRDYRQMFPAIAREIAKIHALVVPVRKVPDFWLENMKKWLLNIKSKGATFDSESLYTEEMEWMNEQLRKSQSPIVYCHNDLQGGNILLRQDSTDSANPKLILIDFEFGAYNYRGFDLANQFCEWCFDYNVEEYPHFVKDFNKFPSKDEQVAFIGAYLGQLVTEGEISLVDVDQEVTKILKEIPLFCMASHLLWSLWSTKMSFSYNQNFAYLEYGRVRRQAYVEAKKEYCRSALCNGGGV